MDFRALPHQARSFILLCVLHLAFELGPSCSDFCAGRRKMFGKLIQFSIFRLHVHREPRPLPSRGFRPACSGQDDRQWNAEQATVSHGRGMGPECGRAGGCRLGTRDGGGSPAEMWVWGPTEGRLVGSSRASCLDVQGPSRARVCVREQVSERARESVWKGCWCPLSLLTRGVCPLRAPGRSSECGLTLTQGFHRGWPGAVLWPCRVGMAQTSPPRAPLATVQVVPKDRRGLLVFVRLETRPVGVLSQPAGARPGVSRGGQVCGWVGPGALATGSRRLSPAPLWLSVAFTAQSLRPPGDGPQLSSGEQVLSC